MLNHANHQATEGSSVPVAASTTGPVRVAKDPRAPRWRALRWFLLPAALVPSLALALALALTWEGVYPGVRLGGVALGGVDRAGAAARIDAEAARQQLREAHDRARASQAATVVRSRLGAPQQAA